MKKLLIGCTLIISSMSANAAYSFPENAVTSEKNRIVSLESLNYTIDVDKPKTMDDLKLCLAEVADNNGDDFIKAETETAIIIMGNTRIDKNSWGNDELVKYELKVSNNSNTLKLRYYNLGFGYIKPNQNPEDIKIRKPATNYGGGGKEAVSEIGAINQRIRDCIEY